MLIELNDKKLFRANFEQVKNNVHRYKDLNKYKKVKVECNPRPVTILNTEICKKEIILPLIELL